MMKNVAMCIGVLFAVVANAELTAHAKLVGQRTDRAAGGASSLICLYSGPRAKYEIVAQHGTCAPYLDVQ